MNRLLAGGGVLLRRLTSWYLEERFLAAAGRVLGTIFAAGFAAGILIAAPVLWWPVAGAWLIASWCATPAAEQAAAEDDDEEEVEEPDLDGFLAQLHRLAPGPKDRLHLAQIAEALELDPAAVREMCTQLDIPVDAVRVKGRSSSTGIKAEDLPPLPTPSQNPVVGVVAAGHSNNNNVREGFYSEPDPDRGPNSTKVIWVTEPVRQAS